MYKRCKCVFPAQKNSIITLTTARDIQTGARKRNIFRDYITVDKMLKPNIVYNKHVISTIQFTFKPENNQT